MEGKSRGLFLCIYSGILFGGGKDKVVKINLT